MSLRNRLLLSYGVVIAITTLLASITFLVLLDARPAPPELTYRKLNSLVAASVRTLLTQSARPSLRASLVSALDTFAETNAVRVLTINRGSSLVLHDSSGVYAPGDALALEVDANAGALSTMPVGQGLMQNRLSVFAGSFDDPDGSAWLFVGYTLERARALEFTLLLADQPPPATLGMALREYGRAVVRPLLQAAGVGLLVAAAMAWLVSRTIANPLQHIARAASAVARGDYDQRVPISGPPEVRAVAESFNRMSAAVQASQTAQRDFVANVSHDLKTPLTSIQGYSQAIVDGAAPDPVEAARIIYEEAGRLNRLVVELTDLARLQDGSFSMRMAPLEIGQIVASVAQRLAIVADKAGLTLTVETAPTPEVNGDGDRLAQVITNLISNAIKYTPRGGRVWVRTQASNGSVEVTVQDTGIGIPPEELPRIFERFYQVDRARGPQRGTGLGLAIAQEIAQAHGGRLTATSNGPNTGATFTLWLPALQVKAATSRRR
ncbi:MAG: sensor histidine kinase [Aggregatilineales bacterium]